MADCYTYMLRCGDGSLYTGWTNDLAKRLQAHQSGKGGKYTRSHLPVTLAYCEVWPSKEEAMRREVLIKRLPREEKLRLATAWKEAREPETEKEKDIVVHG